MPTTEALEGIATDLRSRIAALRERIANLPVTKITAREAQEFNVWDLEDELAGVERQLQTRTKVRPADLAWYMPARKSREPFSDLKPSGDRAVVPWIGVRRSGQVARLMVDARGKVRARVADRYEVLVDGAVMPGSGTRREVCSQVHVLAAGALYGGTAPSALRLRGRALSTFLFRNRADGHSNRKTRKARKRWVAYVRSSMARLAAIENMKGRLRQEGISAIVGGYPVR